MKPIRCKTVGELKAALATIDDSTPVIVERGDWSAADESPEVYLSDNGRLVLEHPYVD
ncbi:hypothetical protein [Rhodococcoides fascians]|uniref:hypothetical protein n=1 Tax=Rhodococcoides fascians TaxID=1828 RepID=UPI0037A3FA38